MPGTPAANWFVLAFLAMVLVLLAFNKDTVIALYVAPVWVVILVVGYLASRSHHVRDARVSRRPSAPTRRQAGRSRRQRRRNAARTATRA